MKPAEFESLIKSTTPVGSRYKNFGKGETTICALDDGSVTYQRGKGSTFRVAFDNLFSAYMQFRGKRVSTNDLKQFNPDVFDSTQGGHNCHCTVLFRLLLNAGLASDVEGKGVAGKPFSVKLQP